MIVSDSTTAKLSEIMQNNRRGITIYRDELSGLLAQIDGKGEAAKDRADYLQLYNGGPHSVERIARGSLNIPNWSGSIIGGIQPGALEKAMRNATHDGLIQRFYPIIAHKVGRATNETVDPQHMQHFATVIDRLNGFGFGTVTLWPDAAQIMDETWGEIYALIAGGALSDRIVAHLSKWEGGLYRWLLVYHAMECAFAGQVPHRVAVSAHTARIVADLHMRYFLPCVLQLYEDVLSDSNDSEQVRWIAGHIVAHGLEKISLRDITRAYNDFAANDEQTKMRVMRMLEDCGWVEPDDPHKMLPRRYKINPAVHERFAKQAAEEKKRRAEIVKKIRDIASVGE